MTSAAATSVWCAVIAAVIALILVPLLSARVQRSTAVTAGVLAGVTLAALAVPVANGRLDTQVLILVVGALAVAALTRVEVFTSSLRLMALAIGVVAVALAITGSALPVFHVYWINALITVALFVPLVLMVTNLEGAPNTQISVTPVMATGAAIVAVVRGDHGLGAVAVAAGGACIGISLWHWLGHRSRVSAAVSIFLAIIVIGAGTGFEGKTGWSVLAVGIGLLVIPVTDLFVIVEGRRRAGRMFWGHGEDHLYYRLIAHGLTSFRASAVIIAAASLGVSSSCLTAEGIIPWPVGLCFAWAIKLGLTFWALRSPDPQEAARQWHGAPTASA